MLGSETLDSDHHDEITKLFSEIKIDSNTEQDLKVIRSTLADA